MFNEGFLQAKFRIGSGFLLQHYRMLLPQQKEWINRLADKEEVYGLFLPTNVTETSTAKIAYNSTALLYFHLQTDEFLPYCFSKNGDKDLQNCVAQLVLDGIFEIKYDKQFVSGSQAMNALYNPHIRERQKPISVIGLLSLQAIRYAFLLRGLSQKELMMRLYTFNTSLSTVPGLKTVPDSGFIQTFLFGGAKNLQSRIEKDWYSILPSKSSGWFSFMKRNLANSGIEGGVTYKLYISPITKDLPVVFQKTVPVLNQSPCFCFKISGNIRGLRRPDKFVAYFTTKDDLLRTANRLEKAIGNSGAQGVPFTTQLDKKGLLSWGIDPEKEEWQNAADTESWRTMVTKQLAAVIKTAQAETNVWEEALPFLNAKLYSLGTDPRNWTTMSE